MEKKEIIAGMTLPQLQKDYRERIFGQYLPFWTRGGYDDELGGFMCELYDDGSVENDEKYIWYQGRGIWVYSFLFNNFGKEKHFIEIARKSRDFMVNNMHQGNGRWIDSVNRQGRPINSSVAQGSAGDIYGALFSAAGLIEYYRASGDKEDLQLALDSIMTSVRLYEDMDYEGITIPGVKERGLRTQGHSFVLIWILTNLLSFHEDAELEQLQKEHVGHIMNHFWNPQYSIANEYLYHDYSRIPGYESVMATGHSLEALWMVLHEAIRKKDKALQDTSIARIRHLVEMNWDYVFGGLGTESYQVFRNGEKCPGPELDLKSMWAQTELLIATMTLIEHTDTAWAKEWYERGRNYCLRTMANTQHGVWRQGVDRSGKDKQRPGISVYRKDNFHQVRYMMMNLLSIERMIGNDPA
jgi:N-acylglucosamine 2-epimerase